MALFDLPTGNHLMGIHHERPSMHIIFLSSSIIIHLAQSASLWFLIPFVCCFARWSDRSNGQSLYRSCVDYRTFFLHLALLPSLPSIISSFHPLSSPRNSSGHTTQRLQRKGSKYLPWVYSIAWARTPGWKWKRRVVQLWGALIDADPFSTPSEVTYPPLCTHAPLSIIMIQAR